MKSAALALFCLVVSSHALADKPYPHEYENGGHFDGYSEAEKATAQRAASHKDYASGRLVADGRAFQLPASNCN